MRLLEALRSSYPDHADVHLGLSQVHINQQQWHDAITALERAEAILGDVPDIQFALFRLQLTYGDIQQALDSAQRFTKGPQGKNPRLLAAFTQVFVENREHEGLTRFIGHIQFSSTNAFQNLINELKQFPNAMPAIIQVLQHAVRRYPDVMAFWQQLSQAQAQSYQYQDAIASFSQLIQQSSHSAVLCAAFADLYLLAQDVNNARLWINKAMEMDPNLASAHEIQVRLDYFCGQQNRQAAEHLLALAPHNGYGWRTLVETTPDKSLAAIMDRLESAADNVKDQFHSKLIHYVLGKARTRLRDYDRAYTAYNTANQAQQQWLEKMRRAYSSGKTAKQFQGLKQLQLPTLTTQCGSPTPVFIVGLPRSGTTLLDKIIQQAPDVHSLGESMVIEQQVRMMCFDMDIEPVPQQLTEQQIRALKKAYEEAQSDADARLTVDKMPHNFRFVSLILAAFPTARILQMRRQPEANIWSVFTQPFSDSHNYSVGLEQAADFYQQSHQLMDYWAQTFPASVMDVQYESLVTKPEDELKRLFSFCQLDWHPEYLNFYQHNSPSFTFSENQVRQPLNQKGLTAWQPFDKYLSEVGIDKVGASQS